MVDGLTTILIALLIASLQTAGGAVDRQRALGVVAVLDASLHAPPGAA
jgi:hypothetical protein